MPELPDQVAGELIEASWGNDIRDRTVQRYTTDAERDSLNPTPAEGELAYIESTGAFQVYTSSFGGWTYYVPSLGPFWDYIATEDATDATADFVDLNGSVGPTVVGVPVLASGALAVTISMSGYNKIDRAYAWASVEIKGPTGTVHFAPSLDYAWGTQQAGASQRLQMAQTFVITGLPQLVNGSVTVKYKASVGSQPNNEEAYFRRRGLWVRPI